LVFSIILHGGSNLLDEKSRMFPGNPIITPEYEEPDICKHSANDLDGTGRHEKVQDGILTRIIHMKQEGFSPCFA
jgi:hypothetical protein